MLWVHYIEPHAPYVFQRDYAGRLGIAGKEASKSDRYDTEIAAVDAEIGRLVREARRFNGDREMIIVFTADHGESLGEHHYWGHGRYLYEPSLRIPLAVVWDGVIEPGTVAGQASLLDLKPTILELAGLSAPPELPGFSWAETLRGGVEPAEASRCYQAHKGAVHGSHDSDRARSKGLLWVGVIEGHRKELYRVGRQVLQVYDLEADPGELDSLASADAAASEELLACLATVSEGLGSLDRLTTQKLDDETVERLRALGYLE
jgi:arylsulfatase A-like enzyme